MVVSHQNWQIKFIILKKHQKEPVHTWRRGQDAFPLSLEKTNLVLVEVFILALGIITVFKTPE